jgi:hypothetical protein
MIIFRLSQSQGRNSLCHDTKHYELYLYSFCSYVELDNNIEGLLGPFNKNFSPLDVINALESGNSWLH